MNKYLLSINDRNFKCVDQNNKDLNRDQIFNLLYDIDAKQNKVYLQGDKLVINDLENNYSLTLENPMDFVKSDYRFLLKECINQINNNIFDTQIAKHKGKKIVKQAAIAVSSVVAPIVLISTLYGANNKNTVIEKSIFEPIPQDEIVVDNNVVINNSIEEDINNIEIIEDKNVIVDNTIENSVVKEKKESPVEEIQSDLRVSLDIENKSIDPEIIEIQDKYRDFCQKAGKKWGISPNLLLGILTQETHGTKDNLMQITFSSFKDEVMKAYNYDEDKWIKVVLTNTPNKYNDADIRISEAELNNPFTNIATAAIILNCNANKYKINNVFCLVDLYNKGPRNFSINMQTLEASTSKTREQVLNDPLDTDPIRFAHVCKKGDKNYDKNVLQYVPEAEDCGIYYYRMEDNEKKLIAINVDRTLSLDLAKSR